MWNITIHISSLLIFIHLLLSKDCNLSLYPRQENQMKIRNPLPTIPALSKAFGSFSCNDRKERDRFSPCSFPCRHPPVLYESDIFYKSFIFQLSKCLTNRSPACLKFLCQILFHNLLSRLQLLVNNPLPDNICNIFS